MERLTLRSPIDDYVLFKTRTGHESFCLGCEKLGHCVKCAEEKALEKLADYEDMREAQTKDGWIPLESGVFPGNGDKVLVSVLGREMPDMAIYKEEKYGQGGEFYFAHMKDIKFLDLGDIVTAWMPLPEPYSVETPGESRKKPPCE